MPVPLSRREFLQVSTACAAATAAGTRAWGEQPPSPGNLVLNDDGYVFLCLSDDLQKADLRRYLQSYCRQGVSAVAYCVGDMSWPTLYPTKVGVHYSALRAGDDLKRLRIYHNVDNFASEPGGPAGAYFGAAFAILHEFWKQRADLALGSAYGYYGGCLNYASEVVREHSIARVVEFAGLELLVRYGET